MGARTIFHLAAFVLATAIATMHFQKNEGNFFSLDDHESFPIKAFMSWTFVMAAFYFAVSFAEDLPGSCHDEDVKFADARNYLFNVSMFPAEMFLVAATFLGLAKFTDSTFNGSPLSLDAVYHHRCYIVLAIVAIEFLVGCSKNRKTMEEITGIFFAGCLFVAVCLGPSLATDGMKMLTAAFFIKAGYLLLKFFIANVMTYIVGRILCLVMCGSDCCQDAPSAEAVAQPMAASTTPKLWATEAVVAAVDDVTSPIRVSPAKEPATPKSVRKTSKSPGRSSRKAPATGTKAPKTEAEPTPKRAARKTKKAESWDTFTDEHDEAVMLEQDGRPKDLQSFGIPGIKSPLRGAPTTRLRTRRSDK